MSYNERFFNLFERSLKKYVPIENDYYSTFTFTKTGNNVTHPRTLGFITKVLWELPETVSVDVDIRLNRNGTRFNPDILATSKTGKRLAIDFESPNSSDARVIEKDVMAYRMWIKGETDPPEYLVITSLPKKTKDWELRYFNSGGWNENHKKERMKIRQNPYQYWYGYYIKEFKKKKINPDKLKIEFVNLFGKNAKRQRM